VQPEIEFFTHLGSGLTCSVAPASPHTTTTARMPICPQCGSQRVWKDGLRYNQVGIIQRYLCRKCAYRFSDPCENRNQTNPEFTKSQKLNIKSANDIFSGWNRRGDLGNPRNGALKSTTAPGPKTRREPCNQHEAVKAMESRTQETAAGATTTDPATIQGKIVDHSFWLLKNGYRESTIRMRTRLLKFLAKKCGNLMDPESVKEAIAKHQVSETYKFNMVNAYHTFLLSQGLTWTPPRYQQCEKQPFIPTEREIDDLIASCRPRMATLLQILKETGMRIGEAWKLKWVDVDTVNNVISVNDPEKRSNSRTIKVSSKLIAMLNMLPKKDEKIFGYAWQENMEESYLWHRRQIAVRLQNPRIAQITFHTFRHWKATMEYHRTKDLIHVQKLLGHRNIMNTMRYTQLVQFENDDYHSAVAKTIDEARQLIENGFDYVTDIEGVKLFRKRK
jgi:integrase